MDVFDQLGAVTTAPGGDVFDQITAPPVATKPDVFDGITKPAAHARLSAEEQQQIRDKVAARPHSPTATIEGLGALTQMTVGFDDQGKPRLRGFQANFAPEHPPAVNAFGSVIIDPKRYGAGVALAAQKGWIDEAGVKSFLDDEPAVTGLEQERERLKRAAGDDPQLKALLAGGGRGGAMVGGGLLAARGATAALGALNANPYIAGGGALLAGGVGAYASSAAYDKALAELAKSNDFVASLAASSKIEPQFAQMGELAALVLPIPGSITRLARGAGVVAAAEGAGAAAKFTAKQLAAGAGTMAGVDTIIRGAGQALGMKDMEITPGTVGTSALFGAILSGHGLKFADYETPQVADILNRGLAWEKAKQTTADGGLIPKDTAPLKPAEQQVFDKAVIQLNSLKTQNAGQTIDPATVQLRARQVSGAGGMVTEMSGRARRAAIAEIGGEAPPEPASAPSAAQNEFETQLETQQGVKRGAPTVVFGAGGAQFPATFAWAPRSLLQASIAGPQLASNPDFTLTNTRDYSDPAEQDKALDVRNRWDARRHVTDAGDASVGLPMVARVIDEQGNATLAAAGGNTRLWALQNLPPEKQAETLALANQKAAGFGLEPTDDPDATPIRFLGNFDFRKTGERDRLQGMVDALNPSPGRVQGTAKRAELDVANVPLEKLAGLTMEVAPDEAQTVVRGLIADGTLDRNRSSATAESKSESQDYVQRLLVNAAFRQPTIAEARNDTRSSNATLRGLIDAATPALISLRQQGAHDLADAIARTFTTTIDTARSQGVDKLHDALGVVADQHELDPAHIPAQAIAGALRRLIVTDAKGRVQAEPTLEAARALFQRIDQAVQHHTGEDLFGPGRTLTDTVLAGIGVAAPNVPSFKAVGLMEAAARRLAEEEATRDALREEPADYSPIQAIGDKGSSYNVKVQLAGLPGIKIIQMPELVQLARELMGTVPEIGRLRKARGHFVPMGNGRIKLDGRIFSDPASAAKTLGHEFFHLTDYLPQHLLQRGNLWGRIMSVRGFMKERWTSHGPTNKELRAELIALSDHWKPIDRTAPKSYIAYRESAVELYADFGSVLINSPATAKQFAPRFYREFFAALDTAKPEFKKAFFDLQAWLNRPAMEILKDRAIKADEMFAKGEAIFEAKWQERQARHEGFAGWLSRFKQEYHDNYAPIVDRAGSADARTAWIFEAHPLADNLVYRWLERMQRTVIAPIEGAGFSQTQLGQLLFYNRIANERYAVTGRIAKELGIDTGGRSVIANPRGETPQTARLQLLRMRLENGTRAQTLLEAGAQKFHDEVFQVMQEAHQAGLLTDAQMTLIAGNRDNYATFTPLEYVDTFVPAGLRAQAGTFKDSANPFFQTVLKMITMHRAIEFQRVKTAAVQILQTHFPAEIERAATRRDAMGGEHPLPSRDPKQKQIELREAGKPVWYNVPAEIGTMFEKMAPGQVGAVLGVVDSIFRGFFYKSFITFNPLFQLLRNPLRDARRTYVNAPSGIGLWDIARQLPLLKQVGSNTALEAVRALVRQGEQHPVIAEMLDNLAITPGEATFATTGGKPASTFDRMLEQFGVLPAQAQARAWTQIPLVKQIIIPLAKAIETAGRMNELLPKVSAYHILTNRLGWAPGDAAHYVRTYVGTPNWTKKGNKIATPAVIFPFTNIWMKGWHADATLALKGYQRSDRPDAPGKSPASFWFRWAATSGIWTVLKVAASLGLLGIGLKKLMDGVSSHYKANYDILPLGHTGKSDFDPKGKVAFIPIPKDPTDRVLSGILYNTLRAGGIAAARAGIFGDDIAQMNANEPPSSIGDALTKNLSVGASDMPGLNPLLKIADGWKTYLAGQNPIDSYRGSFVLSDKQFLAGGWDGAKPMIAWTYGQTGLQSFMSYDPHANTTLEQTIASTPVLSGLVKITDYGFQETQQAGERLEKAAAARVALGMPNNAQQLAGEFSMLRGLGKADRNPAQEDRYRALSSWHQKYKIAEEQISNADDNHLSSEQVKGIRAALERESKTFER